MLEISPIVAQHYPNLQKECKPIRKKLRRFHLGRREVMKQEVEKLITAGFIKEIQYPEWLSNVVVVPKKNGKCRCVCIDYYNLNNACPKDTFPLPRIDQIVDAIADHQLLSFLDVYFWYNQILMYPPNSVNTTFITPTGMYCYNVMPFGMKNSGATYKCMMSRIFLTPIGKTMEAFSALARGVSIDKKAPIRVEFR